MENGKMAKYKYAKMAKWQNIFIININGKI